MKKTRVVPQVAQITGVFTGAILFAFAAATAGARQTGDRYPCNDEHVHITSYIQEGADIHVFVKLTPEASERARKRKL